MEITDKLPPECAPLYFSKHLKGLLFVWLGLFLYGMSLPSDWARSFGMFARPLLWATEHIPSVRNIATVTGTWIPETVTGFFALAVYIPPLYALYILYWTIVDHAEPGKLRLLLPVLPQTVLNDGLFNKRPRLFFLTASLFCFCCFAYFYIYPFNESNVNAVGRGRLFKELMYFKFTMACTGATMAVIFSYLLAASLFFFIYCCGGRFPDKHHD